MAKESLQVYNSLTRRKEKFVPVSPPFAGMYVCGPTVYGDAHLGHARPAVTFDLLFRYLKYLGYKVRYVRNITDVGHLEGDADQGEDKIAKKARLEQLEPMEVVQYFSDRYHEDMDKMNVLRPSIEPRASGHIIEQIEMAREILEAGFAYTVNGSVYFDVQAYNRKYNYGRLSGRKLEEMMAGYRELEGQDEKRHPADFALWKKASPGHLMKWPSPWGEGFPGWHLECSAMSSKYLGEEFDIHGGGMDLLFPHHECEIAQSNAANGKDSARYWMHNNMVTINGQKMGKSLGNFITLREFFTGGHKALNKAYSPLVIRFFILQAHYRSTLDFGNEALEAADKGLNRLLNAMDSIRKITPSDISTADVSDLPERCHAAMLDDLNSPVALAHLFEAAKTVNSAMDGSIKLTGKDLELLERTFSLFVSEIFGLSPNKINNNSGRKDEIIQGLMEIVIELRQNARQQKDWSTSDRIRKSLGSLNISIKDSKEGSSWELN